MVRWTADYAWIAAAGYSPINTHTAATTLVFRTARAFAGAIGGTALITFCTNFTLRTTLIAAPGAWWTTFAALAAFPLAANPRSTGAGAALSYLCALAAMAIFTFPALLLTLPDCCATTVAALLVRWTAIVAFGAMVLSPKSNAIAVATNFSPVAAVTATAARVVGIV